MSIMPAARTLAATGIVLALTAAPVAAQSPEAVRDALLAPPNGWTMNWPQAHAPWTGVGTVRFERRGDGLVAMIENNTAFVSCEREVSVTANGASFDLCRETGLVLRYDPRDAEIPFRGRTAQRWYIYYPR
jgi:hypothetical protein